MTDETPAPTADILIVDDVPANLDVLSNLLYSQGYEVRAAINGVMALRAVQATPPDLILLDVTMPELDGYEVCRRLKAEPDTNSIPIIFISALNEALDKVRAFEVGGADYITKPFQLEEVVARVQHQLTIRRLQQELECQLEETQLLNAQLQGELAMARNIQNSLLPPSLPEWRDLDVVCYTRSAREVGGDLYAYHAFQTDAPAPTPDAQRYALAVGDVSGKGMAAALLMSVSMTTFWALVPQNLSPAALLGQMHHSLRRYARTTGQNCAMVTMDITMRPTHQTTSAGMCVANAGCVAPLIRYGNGETAWVEAGGFPLGMGPEGMPPYQEICLELAESDTLILSSDGVVEAKNAQGELFGFERLAAAVQQGPTHSSAAMLAHLRRTLEAFGGETDLADDMTLVVVRCATGKVQT
jgi:phosphoserine phosphatase RsbU/P